MKKLLFLTIALGSSLMGCSSTKDKYDLAVDHVQHERAETKSPSTELSQTSGKTEPIVIRKGERNPDGKIATENSIITTDK